MTAYVPLVVVVALFYLTMAVAVAHGTIHLSPHSAWRVGLAGLFWPVTLVAVWLPCAIGQAAQWLHETCE